jgi:hypothetical protein
MSEAALFTAVKIGFGQKEKYPDQEQICHPVKNQGFEGRICQKHDK